MPLSPKWVLVNATHPVFAPSKAVFPQYSFVAWLKETENLKSDGQVLDLVRDNKKGEVKLDPLVDSVKKFLKELLSTIPQEYGCKAATLTSHLPAGLNDAESTLRQQAWPGSKNIFLTFLDGVVNQIQTDIYQKYLFSQSSASWSGAGATHVPFGAVAANFAQAAGVACQVFYRTLTGGVNEAQKGTTEKPQGEPYYLSGTTDNSNKHAEIAAIDGNAGSILKSNKAQIQTIEFHVSEVCCEKCTPEMTKWASANFGAQFTRQQNPLKFYIVTHKTGDKNVYELKDNGIFVAQKGW